MLSISNWKQTEGFRILKHLKQSDWLTEWLTGYRPSVVGNTLWIEDAALQISINEKHSCTCHSSFSRRDLSLLCCKRNRNFSSHTLPYVGAAEVINHIVSCSNCQPQHATRGTTAIHQFSPASCLPHLEACMGHHAPSTKHSNLIQVNGIANSSWRVFRSKANTDRHWKRWNNPLNIKNIVFLYRFHIQAKKKMDFHKWALAEKY